MGDRARRFGAAISGSISGEAHRGAEGGHFALFVNLSVYSESSVRFCADSQNSFSTDRALNSTRSERGRRNIFCFFLYVYDLPPILLRSAGRCTVNALRQDRRNISLLFVFVWDIL